MCRERPARCSITALAGTGLHTRHPERRQLCEQAPARDADLLGPMVV